MGGFVVVGFVFRCVFFGGVLGGELDFYRHHPTERTAHTTVFVTPGLAAWIETIRDKLVT